MAETVNNRIVNAEVSFLNDEAWQHLGSTSTLRQTTGVVTKSTPVNMWK